jgi:hypothetical protein
MRHPKRVCDLTTAELWQEMKKMDKRTIIEHNIPYSEVHFMYWELRDHLEEKYGTETRESFEDKDTDGEPSESE